MMNKQSVKETAKKLLLLIINFFILIISFLIPKTDKIVLVGGWYGKRFADNSKHFFLYAHENKEELGLEKVVWVTRSDEIKNELSSQGFNVYKSWSIPSVWYHFRAGIHLVDQAFSDINPWFSIRSKKINLWHGFPLKKIGAYADGSYKTNIQKPETVWDKLDSILTRGNWGKHYVLATSDFSAKILAEAFNRPVESMIVSGYPRNYEPLIENPVKYIPNHEKDYLNKVVEAKKQGDKIIGYFPTFRDKRETLIFGTSDSSEIQEIMDYFNESNIKVIGKFHFAGKDDKFSDLHNHEAFINLPSDADVYTFLSEIDVLMTDYSSIYFDYLLWDRPIIFFPYDLAYYRDEDRGLIFDYDEFTPGPKAFNIEQLKQLLSNGVDELNKSYQRDYGESSDELKRKIFGDHPGKTDIRHLIEQIKNLA
ncbi:CDP-glycerol glycerophosphotransferase family protein [Mesobacillus boroniphilus]|nr:CDP-glycerol glycerophosphotransferase family protein [Mesobacillus boroniphilus]